MSEKSTELSSSVDDWGDKISLTPFQNEASLQIERINEARTASERVIERLAGLKYKSASAEELERLSELDKLSSVKIEQISTSTGIPTKRVGELQQREMAINSLLFDFVQSSPEHKITRDDLKDARYFTFAELVERSSERIDLGQRLKDGVQEGRVDQPTLQRLADEYIFRYGKLFDVDSFGVVIPKKLNREDINDIQKTLDRSISYDKHWRARVVEIVKSSRTGIDPGVLIVSEDRRTLTSQVKNVGGFYCPGSSFLGDLAKIGLIIVPPLLSPIVLKHEYAHFEDWLFRPEERDGFNYLIGEINSMLVQFKGDMPKGDPDRVFELMKGILLSKYFMVEAKKRYIDTDSDHFIDIRKKIIHSVDVVGRLYKIGFSFDVISNILIHANNFDDISQWSDVNDDELRKLVRLKKI